MKNITIIGINGGFGKLFSQALFEKDFQLTGVDQQLSVYENAPKLGYIQANIFDFENKLKAVLQKTDALLFGIPEAVLLRVYQPILRTLTPGTLVIDTLSVKSPILDLAKVRDDLEILSLNPLFAPDLGFQNQNIAAVSLHSGLRTGIFLQLLREWGAKVSLLSAAEHDQLTAITQVATHFSLLSFGACLRKWGYQPKTELFTPVHEILLSLVGRMVSQNAAVYWKIQTDNPYGQIAREMFLESAEEIKQLIDTEAFATFEKVFSGIGSTTQAIAGELKQNFLNYQHKQA
ncbi:MAG TPA: prephenate dehydrogenase/arogenate dehydrogenase family protein [Saprospiraceae bacterium]|nr:prephenate dehydrogenase/arogenate dehydrogenase family protein [Saprospiraceae bacterium]HMQ81658.1 prephenate dehydrogenase/arogenate dehydrogenase family protein [Saprospiraceae bacterium]